MRLGLPSVTAVTMAWSVASGAMAIVATSVTERCRDYVIESWDTGDGMPASSGTAIAQDAHGYLWLGTFGGLVRFDGVQFDVLDATSTPALPNSSVVNVHLDRAGRLWVSTLGGLAIREGGAWRTVSAADGWTGDYVRSFAERPDGSILLSSFDAGVFEWRDDRFTRLVDPPGAQQAVVIAADATGLLWGVRSGFAGYWDGTAWRAVAEVSEDVAPLSVATARDGTIWLVVGATIRKHDGQREVLRLDVPDLPTGIWAILEDSVGNIWISTFDAGVHRVDRSGRVTTWNRRNGLPSDSTRFVFEDRERNLWIGSEGGGLTRFRPRRVQAYGEESGIEERVVRSVWPMRDGSVMVGSYGRGLFRITGETAEARSLASLASPGSRNPMYIQSVREDRAGRLFVGAFGDGLFVVQDGESRAIELPEEVGTNVIALYEDTAGRMWVSGGWSVVVVEDGAASVPSALVGAPLGDVIVFAEDADRRMLLSTRGAVYRLHGDRLEELQGQDGRSIEQVVALRTEDDGSVWMGTSGSGLLRWRGGRIDRVDARHGLPGTGIYGILEDDGGHWWLATSRGIVRVRRAEIEAVADGRADRAGWIALGVADGMLSAECSGSRQPVCGADAEGRLWFATPRGVAMVDPSTFRANDLPPNVVVESVGYVLGGTSSEGSETLVAIDGSVDAGLTLPPGLGRMEIRYTALSLSNPKAMRFEILMDGLDRDWRDVGTARSVVYYMPPPGRYRFRARATNDDGVWSQDEAALTIGVMPFFWQTGWFFGSSAFAAIALCGASVWLVTHRRYARRREADLRFQRVVEAAPNAMILVDGAGRVTMVNAQAEREFGYAPGELIGQPIELLMPERSRAAHRSLRTGFMERAIARTMGEGRDLVGLRKDGTEIPLEIGLSPIRTADGTSILASIVNLTERRERERERTVARNELAHLSRVAVLGELSGALAHELNQPLTAILSNAQAAQRLLRRDPVDMAEILSILSDIVEQDKRAGEVIYRLRALLRKGETDLQPTRVDELVNDATRLVRGELVGHGVELRLEVAPHLPLVRGDRVQLQQVIVNLLVNAHESIRDGARDRQHPGRAITVAATAADGRVSVSVRDEGPGIPDTQIDQLFEPFFTTKSTGLGLGLAICRSIIDAHSGEIVARNVPSGGAEVIFTLPAIQPSPNEHGDERPQRRETSA